MRFVRYTTSGTPQWGVLVDRKVHALSALSTGTPILSKIGDSNYRQTIRRKVENETLPVLDRETISLLAPIAKPGKIICAGMNYHDHADEQNENVPEDHSCSRKRRRP